MHDNRLFHLDRQRILTNYFNSKGKRPQRKTVTTIRKYVPIPMLPRKEKATRYHIHELAKSWQTYTITKGHNQIRIQINEYCFE